MHTQNPRITEFNNNFGPEISGIVNYSRMFYEVSLDLHNVIDDYFKEYDNLVILNKPVFLSILRRIF